MKSMFTLTIAAFLSCSLFAQSANLKYQLEKNKVYRVKAVSDQDMSQTMNGNQISSDISSSMILSFKATDSDANLISADVRFDSMAVETNMPGMSMYMNSAKPGKAGSQGPSDIMSSMLSRLSHCILHVKMTYGGNIAEITNFKSVRDSTVGGIDSLQGQMSKMIQAQAKNMVSEGALKGMIESVTAYLPGKEVKAGDKWETRFTQSAGGGSMLIVNSLNLKKVAGTNAEISCESTIEPANQNPMEMNGAQITSDLRGMSKTSLTVDITTGWIRKGSSKNHTQGTLFIKMAGNDMQMPMEVDGTTEITALP